MAGIASAIAAAAAVAGVASSVYGMTQKGKGVAANNEASDAITAQKAERALASIRRGDEIARWYLSQSNDLVDKSIANSAKTIATGDGAYIEGQRAKSEADRAKAGIDLITGAPTGASYTDYVPDSSGAVRSENARQLAKALDLGKARATAGAKVNAYGDSLFDAGVNTGRGTQNQQVINREQSYVDKTAALRNKLNSDMSTPAISDEDSYRMVGRTGADAFNLGNAIQAGGNLISAAGAYGVGDDVWNNLFQGSVPTKDGVYGPQQPGLFTRWFR